MNAHRLAGIICLAAVAAVVCAQQVPFDVQAYQAFRNAHKDITAQQLQALHPAGTFLRTAGTQSSAPLYSDSIAKKFALTADELRLLGENGFVVSERLSHHAYDDAFLTVYGSDMPVFISTDAILHAFHMSYDHILQTCEKEALIPQLTTLLASARSALPTLATTYASNADMKTMLNDVDIYLSIPQILLTGGGSTVFPENASQAATLLALIRAEQPAEVQLFSEAGRVLDFSQFTVRGHYTQDSALGRYFRAMMWLGRTEISLASLKNSDDPAVIRDIRRQRIDALLVSEAVQTAGVNALFESIEQTIAMFVGEQDNVMLPHLRTVATEAAVSNAAALLDPAVNTRFGTVIASKPYYMQRINSQILMHDPMSDEPTISAPAFLLLGQRFILDSYVFSNVVYDRVKAKRMLPSPLDALAALGNNAAFQLLAGELDRYQYAPNLAALRYLVDSYDQSYWDQTLYTGWLQAIKTLNPPASREELPAFMKTAAWWQAKMTTQAASWAELRHDNLLYAKQSYSAGVICSFPESYVEPIPVFYETMARFSRLCADRFNGSAFQALNGMKAVAGYFSHFARIMDTLQSIAGKTLAKTPCSQEERRFLGAMVSDGGGMCGAPMRGWYPTLYYGGESELKKMDYLIADVHTAPTDADGSPVGWVMHAGTGPLNMAVVAAELPDGRTMAFIGPVASYYDYVTTGFKRLTDEEWKEMPIQALPRPLWTHAYLADPQGNARAGGMMLQTSVDPNPAPVLPSMVILERNYPNPFNASTVIPISIPESMSGAVMSIAIYDLEGRCVRDLVHTAVPAGTILFRWDGRDNRGTPAASGAYFYRLVIGGQRASGKMLLLR